LEYVPSVEMPDEEYPFILTTGRLLEQWHGGTLTRHSKLDDLYPQARIEINPADAARLKIEDGDIVRVSSRRGTVVLRSWVTQRTTVGVVFIPMHFHEAAANLLTIDALDPLAKIPEYKACAVRIAPAETAELAPMAARGRY
jgi:predicted molibdopterin-dependent oxidoreductase YjgC